MSYKTLTKTFIPFQVGLKLQRHNIWLSNLRSWCARNFISIFTLAHHSWNLRHISAQTLGNYARICSDVLKCSIVGSKPYELVFNIASRSEANITTSCEMEIFNFLWLIWDPYHPLQLPDRTIDLLDPYGGVQIRMHNKKPSRSPNSNLKKKSHSLVTHNLTYLRSKTF